MGSITEVRCHVDASADSGTARKNGFVSRERGLSIVEEVSCSDRCNQENVLTCVYIDQTRGDKDGEGNAVEWTKGRSETQEEICSSSSCVWL